MIYQQQNTLAYLPRLVCQAVRYTYMHWVMTRANSTLTSLCCCNDSQVKTRSVNFGFSSKRSSQRLEAVFSYHHPPFICIV